MKAHHCISFFSVIFLFCIFGCGGGGDASNPPDVIVLDSRWVTDSNNFLSGVGEITNQGDRMAFSVQVFAKHYDVNNNFLGEDWAFSTPIDLASDIVGTFDIFIGSRPNGWDHSLSYVYWLDLDAAPPLPTESMMSPLPFSP